MNVIVMLVVLNSGILIGWLIGRNAGNNADYRRGLMDGAESALKLVDKYERRGLRSALNIETARRLLREQMGRN